MSVIDGTTWLEVLSTDECWRRLSAAHLGRIGYLHQGEPEILPVNFAVDGRCIVFRTDPGTKLAAIGRNDRVAFEIDDGDPLDHTGWSVLVKGTAQRVTDGADRRDLEQLRLKPWAIGRKDVFVRIWPETVSGRAIHHRGRANDDAPDRP